LTSVFNTVLELCVPSINRAYFDKGILIPPIPDTNLSNAEITLYNSYLKIGATPVFHEGYGAKIVEEAFKNIGDAEVIITRKEIGKSIGNWFKDMIKAKYWKKDFSVLNYWIIFEILLYIKIYIYNSNEFISLVKIFSL